MSDPSLSVRPHAFPTAGGDAVRTTRTVDNLSWTRLLARLVDGDDLSAAEARWAMHEVALGNVEQAQMAGFLVALRCKGESPQELLGFLEALMQDVVPIPIDGHGLLDLVGTGGDGAHTVNVSTMAAIVAAGSGAKVLKHGGRSASSKAGAADVLEALGLPLDLSPQSIAQCVRDVGIGFTLASRFVPGLRHASPVRKALGVPTAINYIAPLTNPAAPSHSLVGCASMAAAPTLARVLAERGANAIVVHGNDGLDELTTTGASTLWAVTGRRIRQLTIDPLDYGIARSEPESLRGGDAQYNAQVVRDVLDGRPGPVRDAVILNAAAAIATHELTRGNLTDVLADCLERSRRAIDSGAAAATLRAWLKRSGALATTRPESGGSR
jgi:anthranilate phosphoribosyltransferase